MSKDATLFPSNTPVCFFMQVMSVLSSPIMYLCVFCIVCVCACGVIVFLKPFINLASQRKNNLGCIELHATLQVFPVTWECHWSVVPPPHIHPSHPTPKEKKKSLIGIHAFIGLLKLFS